VLKVKAKAFFDTLTHLKAYVFGSITDLQVTCTSSKVANHASLTLDVISGQVSTSMEAEYSAEFKLAWGLAKILPWVEYITILDTDAVISCGQKDGCHVFSARAKHHRLLVVAETV